MSGHWNDIGPCQILWDAVNVGDTYQGAVIGVNIDTVESFRDRTGTLPTDEFIKGTKVMVEANLTAVTLAQIAAVLPGATLIDTGTKMTLKSTVGLSMRDNAKPLILKPIIAGVATTNRNLWFQAALAFPVPQFEIQNDLDNQRVYKTLFKVYDNLTSGLLAQWGVST